MFVDQWQAELILTGRPSSMDSNAPLLSCAGASSVEQSADQWAGRIFRNS